MLVGLFVCAYELLGPPRPRSLLYRKGAMRVEVAMETVRLQVRLANLEILLPCGRCR